MADRDIRKLKRQDLLELLIIQSKEVLRMQADIRDKDRNVNELENTFGRLRDRLDEKDAQIQRLKNRLDEKDARIRELEATIAAGTYAAAESEDSELMMNKINEAAQKAVMDYIRRQKEEREAFAKL